MAGQPAKKRAAKKATGAKRLTEAEIEQIVELKLNRVPTRQIATQVGCAPNTVTLHWHQWLRSTGDERREYLDRKQSEIIGRLDSVATLARHGAIRARGSARMDDADRARAEARYLAEERQALRALSTVAGFDAPQRVSVELFETIDDAAAQKIIDEFEQSQKS